MDKAYIISHNDLDGVGSALILEHAISTYSNSLQVEEVNLVGNHDVRTKINDVLRKCIADEATPAVIYVTDLSPAEDYAPFIDEVLKKYPHITFILLDHHKHALPLNKYSWATVVVENDELKHSGTSLVIDHLFDLGVTLDHVVYEFAELVRLYDTWDWKAQNKLEPKRLNDLLYLIGISNFMNAVRDELKTSLDFTILEQYKFVLDLEDERVKRYIERKAKHLKIHPITYLVDEQVTLFNVGVVAVEQYHSELGNALAELNPSLDLIAMVDVDSKKVSLRTINDDVPLDKIAHALGGGGHQKAGGFPLGDRVWEYLTYVVEGTKHGVSV